MAWAMMIFPQISWRIFLIHYVPGPPPWAAHMPPVMICIPPSLDPPLLAAPEVVEQTQDGQKFNRGQLLNVGLRLAQGALPGITSFITHDVDLLPSMDMRPAYAKPPPPGTAVHLASVWPKYTYPGFLGGVLSFRPEDFERANGYPNNYWGWGLEDDQLALRMSKCNIRTIRLREGIGTFIDLDEMNMKGVLDRGQGEEVRRHLPWYNAQLFQKGALLIDGDWQVNGLGDLDYEVSGEGALARALKTSEARPIGPVSGCRSPARPGGRVLQGWGHSYVD
ncbi:unnamed protein product [Prorocentrum cordatum]|uniref:Galactosyltransferase C-terminal domain-containing protein n=1 Tax=Prorocentrum cordatum TaxID=2364126 RepID=A0ABN9P6Q7_9DINO|nr:unnamed protein product [Polarella glacialis]